MKKDFITVFFIISLLVAFYSINRFTLGCSIPDEKRYIQSTKEMLAGGDYITPQYHGKLRFQKPIFFYWLILLSYKIFGITIFGARFPSVAAGALNAVIAFFLARNLFGKKTAIFAALCLATSEISFMYSRFAVPDTVFILFVNAAIFCFVAAYANKLKENFRYLYVYVFMALAMITKGPLGFIFPMAVIITFLGIRREWRVLKDIKIGVGLIIFFLISAPWFIAMIVLHGNEYLGNVWSLEIVKKLNLSASGGPNPLAHYLVSVFYYMGMVFLRNLPWSLFLPAAIFAIPHCKKERWPLDFLFAWFFAIFVVLTLIWSRESYYVLPLSMPFSIFIALYFTELTEKEILTKQFLFKLPLIIIVLFMLFMLVGWTFFVAYGLGANIVLPSLLMLIPLGFIAYAYTREKKRLLMPVSLIVAACAFFVYFSVYVISVADDKAIITFADDIKSVIKKGDLIAASSSGVSYHRLNVYLDEYDVNNMNRPADCLNEFLSEKNVRVFCVLSKADYERFTSEKTKEHTYIIDKAFRWHKFEKEGPEYFLKMLTYITRGERSLFRQSLKDEIYLVSNAP